MTPYNKNQYLYNRRVQPRCSEAVKLVPLGSNSIELYANMMMVKSNTSSITDAGLYLL